MVEIAKDKGVVAGRRMRVDTTVVETNIHYPSDSTLLGDGVRVLTRTMRKISEIVGAAMGVPHLCESGGQGLLKGMDIRALGGDALGLFVARRLREVRKPYRRGIRFGGGRIGDFLDGNPVTVLCAIVYAVTPQRNRCS